MTHPTLRQLQAVDGEMDAARKRLRELEQLLAERRALDEAAAMARDRSAAAAEQRGLLRDRELELKSLEARMRELDQKLYGGRVRNPKELENLEKEARMFKQHQGRLEEGVLDSLDATERGERDAQQAQQRADTLRAERTRAELAWRDDAEQLRSQLLAGEVRANALRAQLDGDQLEVYDRLRRRSALAVAPVRGHNCGACAVGLSTRVVEQAHDDNALAQCDNCGRILCYA